MNCYETRNPSTIREKKDKQKHIIDIQTLQKIARQITSPQNKCGLFDKCLIDKSNTSKILAKIRSSDIASKGDIKVIINTKNKIDYSLIKACSFDKTPITLESSSHKCRKDSDECITQDRSLLTSATKQQKDTIIIQSRESNKYDNQEASSPKQLQKQARDVVCRQSKKRPIIIKTRDASENYEQFHQFSDEKFATPLSKKNLKKNEYSFIIKKESYLNNQLHKEVTTKEIVEKPVCQQYRGSSNTNNNRSPTIHSQRQLSLEKGDSSFHQPISLPRIEQIQLKPSSTSKDRPKREYFLNHLREGAHTMNGKAEQSKYLEQQRGRQGFSNQRRDCTTFEELEAQNNFQSNMDRNQSSNSFERRAYLNIRDHKQDLTLISQMHEDYRKSQDYDEYKQMDLLTPTKKQMKGKQKKYGVSTHQKIVIKNSSLYPQNKTESHKNQFKTEIADKILINYQYPDSNDKLQETSSHFFKLQQYYFNKYESVTPNLKEKFHHVFQKQSTYNFKNNSNTNLHLEPSKSAYNINLQSPIEINHADYQIKDEQLEDNNNEEKPKEEESKFKQQKQIRSSSQNAKLTLNQSILSEPTMLFPQIIGGLSMGSLFPQQMTTKQIKLLKRLKENELELDDFQPWEDQHQQKDQFISSSSFLQ